jgi:hypothetical protein
MIAELEKLKNHPGLNSSVGPGLLGIGSRVAYADLFGNKQDFLAQANKLVSKSALNELIQSKKEGATFGALSDREMDILKAASTALGTWEVKGLFNKDKVSGYNTSEKKFKEEIQRMIDEYKELLSEAGDPLNLFK